MIDHLGYADLQIPPGAPRTRKLQQLICAYLEADGSGADADRVAVLGLMQIVGELEHHTRHPADDDRRGRRGQR